ncbi:hypothetical protein FYJ43_06140 [Cutibacterium sp. WCA-380-WT-3A]|uniref:Uncharacterized protein n=1 Tax=Cutibacterium porci TaxID=2605781 RepID=A0A7K0J6Q2_9ACTN|nr:hypothetical protein [Cutibacterium porci]MSS45627.1 hypothetical protein [Cutibacterium porci]
MSAQTYEWDIKTTPSHRGDLVVGPWQDELAEPVVVIDRQELMAGRPGAIAHHPHHDRLLDVAVLATITVMIVGVILALGRLGQIWRGDPAVGYEGHTRVVHIDGYQPAALSEVRS